MNNKAVSRVERRRQQTRQEIIETTWKIIDENSLANLSVDAVAKAMGITKPAIYYYFPSKQVLLQALIVEALSIEVDQLCAAIDEAKTGTQALGMVVRTFVNYYSQHTDRFRLVYLQSQLVGLSKLGINSESTKELIHPYTNIFFDKLVAKLDEDRERGELASQLNPRRLAMTAHLAGIGVMTMKGVADSAQDPLKFSDEELIEEYTQLFLLTNVNNGV